MSVVYDISKVRKEVTQFEDGYYEATVVHAESAVSDSSSDPFVKLRLEVYHPDIGLGVAFDNLPQGFPQKAYNFVQALGGYSDEEMNELDGKLEIIPEDWIGVPCIVRLKTNIHKGREYKNVDAYFNADSEDAELLLNGNEDDLPI